MLENILLGLKVGILSNLVNVIIDSNSYLNALEFLVVEFV